MHRSRSPPANLLYATFDHPILIYRLRAFGYGKEVLRGRSKVYLADPALPGAVLLLGRRLLEKPDRLAAAVETAFFKHLYTRYYPDQPTFSCWQDKSNRSLDK
jgi:predicted AAA+ superfamily ATPase